MIVVALTFSAEYLVQRLCTIVLGEILIGPVDTPGNLMLYNWEI